MRKGTLYVFTGPSGAGKGTVLGRLLAEDDRLFFSISATTRAPRPGEQNGVHYYFLEKTDFENRIAQGAFLEHAQYVGNYYGTLEAPVNEKLDEGFDVILEIEVQGAMQDNDTYTTTQQRCKTVYDKSEKMLGYDVTYKIGDQQGKIRMDKDPGTQIPLDGNGQLVLNNKV